MTQIDLAVGNADFAYEMKAELTGVTVLFGPSGVGKTTILRSIAGLAPDLRGTVTYGGKTLQNSMIGTFIPPHKRGIATVFQDGRLFPHMNVARNLDFAVKRAPKVAGPDKDTVIAALDLGPLMNHRPTTLSGGEKQRVALGRALLSRPDLILMDEPLASLDMDRKDDILPYVATLPDVFDLPVLYVTHALAEVAQIATQVLSMTSGTVAPAISRQAFMDKHSPKGTPATITEIRDGRTYLVIDGELGATGDTVMIAPKSTRD